MEDANRTRVHCELLLVLEPKSIPKVLIQLVNHHYMYMYIHTGTLVIQIQVLITNVNCYKLFILNHFIRKA